MNMHCTLQITFAMCMKLLPYTKLAKVDHGDWLGGGGGVLDLQITAAMCTKLHVTPGFGGRGGV